MKFNLLVYLLLFCFVGSSYAQSVTVRAMALNRGEIPETFVKTKDEYTPLRFSSIQPSKSVKAMTDGTLPLFRGSLNEKGEIAYTAFKKLKIPYGSNRILLLSWTRGEKTTFYPIRDELSAAQKGDWLLVNSTPSNLEMKLDKTNSVSIPKGSSKTYRSNMEKNRGIAVAIYNKSLKSSPMFYSTYWPLYAEKRTIVFFIPDGDRVKVKRISDKLIKEKGS